MHRLGPHGLPLIGRADWNDCLNLNCFSDTPGESFQTTENKEGGVAESVFIGGLFVLAAEELAQIAERRGHTDEAQSYRRRRRQDEPRSYSSTAGTASGSGAPTTTSATSSARPQNEEGQIFIEPQGMCIIAGIGLDDGKAVAALDSVAARLATEHGIVLQQPAFSHYYVNLGEISSYPPGYKENAGVFCHTNPWIMIAEAIVGRGDEAFDYYRRINPSAREELSDLHRCEPYVYPQMIAGKDAPTHGEAKNSWLSRHGGLELRRRQPVDSRHPRRARRAPHRPLHSQ